jgi:membrane dipeptidase
MRALILLATLACTSCAAAQTSDVRLIERARRIHGAVITIDAHNDISEGFGTAAVDPCTRLDRQVDLPKMREGGLDVVFFIVYVGQGERTPKGYASALAEALDKFAAIRRVPEQLCPDQAALALSAADVERIVGSGRLAIAIGVENGYPIGHDLSLVRRFHELGGRYLSITHIGHNDLGDSSNPREGEPEQEHGGLSKLGRQVVAEMNRVGMMVDISHVGKAATLEAMRLSRAPVIASHSSSRAVNDNRRNLDDEQLRALRENGGVVQAVAFNSYVRNAPPEKRAALTALRREFGITRGSDLSALPAGRRAEYEQRRAELDVRWPRATVSEFVDHIDYMVHRIGMDHVGISSDFDGGGGVVGWNNAAETFNVTLELVRRGYSEDDIRKLWGGNLLRVWREVERVAAKRHRDAVKRIGWLAVGLSLIAFFVYGYILWRRPRC